MIIRFKSIQLPLLLAFTCAVQAAEECATVAQCNQMGSAAYRAGHYEAAIEAFERQLRRIERDDSAQLELALNNLILANLRAGDAGMAKAWLQLAQDSELSGPATRHNQAKVEQALDERALGASPQGRYLRYSGQAVWSELEISAEGSGYRASFSPLRAGGRVEEYGPAAIGELEGKLVGADPQMHLEDAGLGPECSVELRRDGIRLQVFEAIADGCQDYGGFGISVAGDYIKVR